LHASRRIVSATPCSYGLSSSASSHSLRRPTGSAETSAMFMFATRTFNASGFSFVPWQVGHSCAVWYRRKKILMYCL
jgi:hypothetical protein